MNDELVTYAQNREDIFLWALLGHRKKGFYVDVGSHHPEFHSVTKLFYDRGWRGINIEPNPELNDAFKRARRRDINLNVGAAHRTGKLLFRKYPHHNGLSTFSREIMDLHEQSDLPFEDKLVPIKPLKKILKENKVGHIDFMKIDVEGFEVNVIEGNDWDKYRPDVLVVEATVRHHVDPMLKKLGYKLEFFDGLNNYYLNTVAPQEKLTIFNYAPRILSYGYATKSEVSLRRDLATAQSELHELRQDKDRISRQLLSLKSQPKNVARATRRLVSRYTAKVKK